MAGNPYLAGPLRTLARAALNGIVEHDAGNATVLHVLDNLPVGILVTDMAESPRILWANRVVCEACGWRLSELIGASPSIFHCAETDRGETRAFMDGLRRDGAAAMTVVNARKDGSTYRVRVSARRVDFEPPIRRSVFVSTADFL